MKYLPGEIAKVPVVMGAVPAFGLLYKYFANSSSPEEDAMIAKIYTDGALESIKEPFTGLK